MTNRYTQRTVKIGGKIGKQNKNKKRAETQLFANS